MLPTVILPVASSKILPPLPADEVLISPAEESMLPTVILPVASSKILPPLPADDEVSISPAKILVPALNSILPPLLGEAASRLPVVISPFSLNREIPAVEVIFLEVILFVVIILIATEFLGISS